MPKAVIGNKGQGEWTDPLLVVILSVCVISVGLRIPEIWKDFATMLTLASAEKTARDLGGLITISGTAQDSIVITYEGEDKAISYDVKIKDRRVHITGIRTESGAILREADSTISTGRAKTAVGKLLENFEDVGIFTIEKSRRVAGGKVFDSYGVSANKWE